jgi:hypothetical protein
MIACYTHLLRRDPTYPPDWRWKRAQQLAAKPRSLYGPHDDELIRLTVKYLRRLGRCQTVAKRDRLAKDMPSIHQAHELHVGGDMSASVIQARILARQSGLEIGNHMGISHEVIASYEALIFDLRDRLDARMCVHVLALRRPTPQDSEAVWLGWVLRTMAFYGGPLLLDLASAALLESELTLPDKSTVNPSELVVRKVRLLASLLTLPDDGNPLRQLDLLIDLASTTHVGGAYLESPLAGVSEQVIDQAAEILGKRVIEDAVETDLHTDVGISETETWQAA